MWLRIDPRDSAPVFAQIVGGVKGALARGELTSGERLPSVRELARELSINPNTVVKAYRELESLGLVVRRQGSGCFVSDRGSELAESVRLERLEQLATRAATEAFHLGLSHDEALAAFERALGALAFDRSEGQETKGR